MTDELTWDGLTIGGPGADLILGEGVEGLAQVGVAPAWQPRSLGGATGGTSYPGPRTITAAGWVNGTDGDVSALHRLYQSMAPRPDPADELPLQWSGLMWPYSHAVWVRPTRCEWLTDEQGVYEGAPGVDLQWVASDPTIYAAAQTNAILVATGSPVSQATGQGANAGIEVPWARRAIEVRLTAHGTVRRPRVSVAHGGGVFDEVSFPTLTMTGGQVLTLRPDGYWRVGTRIVSPTGRTERGGTGATWRLRLVDSTGSDNRNAFTMTVGEGAFSGFVKVRSTW